MTLTRRGRVLARVAEVAVVAIPLGAVFGAAALFGLAHPSRTDWALVPLGALLLVLVAAHFLDHVPSGPAQHSQSPTAYAERLASRSHH